MIIGTRGPKPIGSPPMNSFVTDVSGDRRQHVVEVPVVLVVGDEQRRALPQRLVAHQRLEHRPRVVRAVARAGGRVLGVLVRRDDPGDLGDRAGGAVGDELGEHVVDVVRPERRPRVRLPRLHRALDGEPLPRRRGRLLRGLVLLVEPQRVVAVVADPAVVPAAVAHLVVGVHLPGDARLQQQLGVGGDVGELDGVVRRVVDPAVRRARPEVHPVRAGRPEDRLVVPVADGERVGERVVERQVVAGEVAHRLLGLGGDPVVPQAAVARAVVTGPAVVEVARVLRVHLGRVHVEGQQVPEVGPLLSGCSKIVVPFWYLRTCLSAKPRTPCRVP